MNNQKLDFAHLHVHTEFSLLDGAARIKKLVQKVKELGMTSIAITDHGSMYGTINFFKECKKNGIKPIIGCEVYVAPQSRFDNFEVDGIKYHHLILLAKNMNGYKNLTKLVSLGSIEGMYYKPRIDKEILKKYSKDLICLSACVAGELPQAILNDDEEKIEKTILEFVSIFGKEDYYLEVQNHGMEEEKKVAEKMFLLAQKYDLKTVATNDIHYVEKDDASFHDILLCIQMGKTLDDPDRMKFFNDQYYLKSREEMESLFPNNLEAVDNSLEIAEKCNIDFEFGKLHLPNFPLPKDFTDKDYLRKICYEKIGSRYKNVDEKILNRLNYELDMIAQMGYDSYFLIVWDFINYARENKIPVGPGRGSAAGSIVAYILGITNVDPLEYNLLFERFLNPERVTMPDIDIDFCYIRRDEVIEYVKRRYGVDHVAQIITFGTMAAKGAIRDVGRVLNMPYGEVDAIAKLIPKDLGITIDKALESEEKLQQLYEEDENIKKLLDFAKAIEGMPRHASTHAAGVVISKNPVTDYVPISYTDETFVTQYDKDFVEELGLLKMDFLGLRTLTIIEDTIKNIEFNKKIKIDIDKIPLVDKKTSDMLTRGDTCGVFQMESSGMTALIKEMRPSGFLDLIPLVALFRPGPLGSGMATDFIKRKHGKTEVTYPHKDLEPILKETFGVILYQEQVMQIVQVLAGFTLGQADILRRAMGKKKHDVLMSQKENFIKGAKLNNVDTEVASNIFDLLLNFADYGFNKSHSVAYALIAWQTAYLMAHYPSEFMASMLTSLMSSDKIGSYLEKCRHLNIKILPPDINASFTNFTVDKDNIRFGLAAVKSVGENAINHIVLMRKKDGPFKSLEDFCNRVSHRFVNKRAVENLIRCGAFDSIHPNRAEYLKIFEKAMENGQQFQKQKDSGQMDLFFSEDDDKAIDLIPIIKTEEFPKQELLNMEKEITGFYITGHPLDEFKNKIKYLNSIQDIEEIKDNSKVIIFGLIRESKRIITKKGDAMCFLQIEDFENIIEVVVFPKVFYQYMNSLMIDMPIVVSGRVQKGENSSKIIADKIVELASYTPKIAIQISRKQEVDEELFLNLKNILHKSDGNIPVYSYYESRNKMVKLDEEYNINLEDGTFEDLSKLLGKEYVKQF